MSKRLLFANNCVILTKRHFLYVTNIINYLWWHGNCFELPVSVLTKLAQIDTKQGFNGLVGVLI